MHRMRLILVGATGYIGKPLFERSRSDFDVIGTSTRGGNRLVSLNLEHPDAFDYSCIEPGTCVVILAAISAPDVCANDHARAWAVNVSGTTKLIAEVLERKGRVIFFSSDTVYGERADEIDETALVNPAGEYALMKNTIEQKFLDHHSFKVVRLSYVFSKDDKFTQYLTKQAKLGAEAEIFHPFYRSIIHRDDVIEGVLSLAKRWDNVPQSIINFGGPENLSRIDFAETLKDIAFKGLQFLISQPNESFFKNRPKRIAMLSPILPQLLERPSRSLRDAAEIEFTRINPENQYGNIG